MSQEKRSNISAILKDAVKFMARHLIFGRICAGILVKDRLYATGFFVASDLREAMSCKDIEEPTQVGHPSLCT